MKIELKNTTDLEQALANSFEGEILIFKHSTRCGISRMALKNFEFDIDSNAGFENYYYLDLIAHRDLSNKIAEDLGVKHESPQLLYIKDGRVIKNQSHHQISL